ncbi:MAG TPA: carboxypeptidase-like regulatory domain-containing protein [bacterium]|jgi:hypothetical protein
MSFGQVGSPQGLAVSWDGTDIVLRWEAVPGAIGYNIYKDINPNVDMSFPYDVSATNSYTDAMQSGAKYFYAVTANVPAGCITGTITDTSGVAAPGVWVSGKLQSDTTVTFHAQTLANGTYTACDLTVGTYNVYVYLEYRPVMQYEVTILEGQPVTLNAQWQPFAWTQHSGHITGNEHWTNNNVYQLTAYTWVDSGATLTIDKGTTIVGNYPTLSMLVIRTGGQCYMYGDKYLPIVLTSNRAIGQRRSGDWGGVTIMGHAHNNRTNGAGSFPVVPNGEGDTGPAGRPDTLFDSESSGVYRYARLEFAGYRFNDVNELNGWAMYGVGRGTTVSYVESTCGKDDQMEFFGGCFNVDHFVSHNTGDDGFDWTDGWNGHAQFVVIQTRGPESDHCIEADNYENGYDYQPRSNPTLANFTLIHAKDLTPTGNTGTDMMLRRGTRFNIHNFIVTLGRNGGVDFDDSSTAWQASQDVDGLYYHRIPNGNSVFDNSFFWDNGPAATEVIDPSTPAGIGDGHFWVEEAEWDEANCRPTQRMCINNSTLCAPTGWTQDITNYRGCGFVGTNATNRVANPLLTNPRGTGNAYDPRPQAGSPCLVPSNAAAPATMQSIGLQYVPYVGAFSGPTDNWMEGWTAFPDFYEQ